jgi:hypothetical protein
VSRAALALVHTAAPEEATPYMKTVDAAALLCFTGPKAIKEFFAWADRYHVPRKHRGRTVLWERRVLEDFLDRKPWTQRRLG